MKFTIRKKLLLSYLLMIILFITSNFIVNTYLMSLANDSNQAQIDSVKSSIDIFTIITVVLGITIALIASHLIKKSINILSAAVNQIAEGDFSGEEIKIKNTDEIGDLTRSLNQMRQSLKMMIGQVSLTSSQVASMSEELMANAEQTSHSTEQIVSSIQRVTANTENQFHSVEETITIVEQMSTSSQQITSSSQNASNAAAHAANISVEGNQAIQQTVQQMNLIHTTVEYAAQTIHELGEQAQHIGKIVEVITGIAAQTNLLALNAAIEAARAGEHGRGFAVVADEVRKLAEESAASGKQISEFITSIQQKMASVVESMEQGTKEVATGIEVVHMAGQSFDKIQSSVQEVSRQINEVTESVQQMAAGADQVSKAVGVISNATEQTAAGTQTVSAFTEEQLASTEEVASTANSLSIMSEELQKLVAKFKV